jgi:thiosulfate dehydrogenase (quinone) large subunit
MFLEATTLGLVAVLVAGAAVTRPSWLRALLGAASAGAPTAPGPTNGSVLPSAPAAPSRGGPLASSTAPGAPATSPSGPVVGTVQALGAAGSSTFTVPGTGDPGVLVRLSGGSIVAFDATCTHAGCPVEYVPQDMLLECPCHGAIFDPARHGSVLAGPTRQPLLELPIVIDRQSGQISLSGWS